MRITRLYQAVAQQSNFFVALPAFIWQILFLWLPLLFVLYAALYTPATGLTIQYVRLVIDAAHISVIVRSLVVAFINATVCLFLAYPVAYTIAFRAGRFKSVALFFVTLPFWINLLVQFYAWLHVLAYDGILNSILLRLHLIATPLTIVNTTYAVLIVMAQAYLPFMILPLYTIFEKFDHRLIEASLDLGASRGQTFWRVTFPLTLPGARIGFFLVFVISFGEYLIPTLMAGGKQLFVGTLISNYFVVARQLSLGAAFTLVSSIALIVALLTCGWFFMMLQRGTRR
ncbi:ABC transporter permease [Candidatus Dependentiae bacterium]|nr:ABC transporter permease [Candidatus Dependentiae bacterium]